LAFPCPLWAADFFVHPKKSYTVNISDNLYSRTAFYTKIAVKKEIRVKTNGKEDVNNCLQKNELVWGRVAFLMKNPVF
jgi:hypothetical protein